jgi:cellulose synthase/poly-beta-1,6-N-acetylglucosamine synthase-like glycosyltransferase
MISLVLLWVRKRDVSPVEINQFPFVSILIAARNEEDTIVSCLEAINKLDYPKDKLEVLIGDDRSEDETAALVHHYCMKVNHFRLVTVVNTLGHARGKANVLAHLAKEAKGELFCITDADIQVPKHWIQGLLSKYKSGIGIVSGVTMIETNTLFSKLQCLEWLFAFGMVKTVSDMGIPVTAVGNNMLISRQAYESTGGYGKIPFSITEDFELFRQALKKGWKYRNLFNQETLAVSKASPSLKDLLRQRKRWMTGALQLPWILVLCLFTQSLFLPLIVTTLIVFPLWGMLLWIIKILLEQVYLALLMRRLNLWDTLLKYSLLFEIYSGILSVIVLVYYALPTGVTWKGRRY